MIWEDRRVERRTIGGDRRADRRYAICLNVQWRLVHRRRVVDSGFGRTIDLSSHGILFEAGRRLAAGRFLELSIAWPALLHDTAPMKLVASGRVIRTDGTLVAIRMTRHEFFTGGIGPDQRQAASAKAAPLQVRSIDISAGLRKN
jgi:hypothetical protein